jgi:hypothetical protein
MGGRLGRSGTLCTNGLRERRPTEANVAHRSLIVVVVTACEFYPGLSWRH